MNDFYCIFYIFMNDFCCIFYIFMNDYGLFVPDLKSRQKKCKVEENAKKSPRKAIFRFLHAFWRIRWVAVFRHLLFIVFGVIFCLGSPKMVHFWGEEERQQSQNHLYDFLNCRPVPTKVT